MRIVVVGAGKLGYSIAELLSNEQMDVVVVDFWFVEHQRRQPKIGM